MDYKKTAQAVLKEVGGETNVQSLGHCMTRLRFVLADNQKVDDQAIQAIPGVIGTNFQGAQYQVIIGNEVTKVFAELHKLADFSQGAAEEAPKEKQNIFSAAIEFISGCMSPLFPALIGSGLVKVLLLIIGPSVFNWVAADNDTYVILNALGDAVFYFLPIMVAATASQRLKVNTYMAVTIAAFLVYPALGTLLGSDTATYLFGVIPVVHASYSSSLIPALLSTILLKYVDMAVDKVTPGFAKNFFKPFATLLLTGLITIVALAPLGAIIGNWVMLAFNAVYGLSPWLAMALFAGFMPFIVMTGMHWAFLPMALMGYAGPGYDIILLPAMLASNIAQAGSAFGAAFKTKDKNMKGMAFPAAISALLAGVSEPALYGVSMKLKKPLYAQMIAGGAAGFVVGLFALKSYSFATPSLLSILQFIAPDGGKNFTIAWVVFAIAFFGSLVLSYLLTDKGEKAKEVAVEESLTVYNPVAGHMMSLSEVDDATFASGVLGKGYAVEPTDGRVTAPFSGTVQVLMDSAHALGLKSDSGVEVLIHIGLDTVKLAGQHFTPKVKVGDRVTLGQELLTFDISAIQAAGYSVKTPVIVTNSTDYSNIVINEMSIVNHSDKMITLEK